MTAVPSSIRRARPADLDALVALERASFAHDRLSRRQYRRHLHNPSSEVLVAVEAARLLGAAVLFYRRGSDAARLYSLAIDASMRGRGIGRALLDAALHAAAAHGARRMRLEVRADNGTAIGLYERAGFGLRTRLPGYYEDGGDGLRYERIVEAPTQS